MKQVIDLIDNFMSQTNYKAKGIIKSGAVKGDKRIKALARLKRGFEKYKKELVNSEKQI